MMLAVAAVAVAGGAVGPVFLRSAGDSSLVAAVGAAPVASTVTTSGQGGRALWKELERLGAAPPGGRKGWFGPPSIEGAAGVRLTDAQGNPFATQLIARSGLCAHLSFATGHCPRGVGEAAISARSARILDVGLGSRLRTTTTPGFNAPRLSVVGIYRLPTVTSAGYWNDPADFSFGAGTPNLGAVDATMVSPPTVWLAAFLGDVPSLSMTWQARPSGLRNGPLGALRQALVAYRTRASRYGLTVSTGLFGLLGGVRSAGTSAATVADVASFELVGVGLLVLYLVVTTAAADRRDETELAARRGFARRQALIVAVGDVGVMLALSLPLGLAAAWAVVQAASGLFSNGTPVTLDWGAVAAAVAVVAAGLLAAAVATWDLWRTPGRAADRKSRSRAARAAAESLAVALAATGLVALAATGSLSGGGRDPLALAAPGLLAVGAGVLGLRLADAMLRLALRATAGSSNLGSFLAVRAIVRTQPSPLRRTLALTAAVTLAGFGVEAWAVTAANRSRVALVDNGAALVADVSAPAGSSLATLVDRADPQGRTAMAVEEIRSLSGDTLAVQADRLAAVAAWPARLSSRPVSTLARYLDPPSPSPISFTGSALSADVSLSRGSPPLLLTATVYNNTAQEEEVTLFATLRAGTRRVTASLSGFCTTTCRLVNLSPTVAGGNGAVPPHVTLALLHLSTLDPGRPTTLAIHAGVRNAWAAEPPGVIVAHGAGGIRFVIPGGDLTAQGTQLTPVDAPSPIPAVATTTALTLGAVTPGSTEFTATGLDGNPIDVAGNVSATRLPELGSNAVLVGLGNAELAQTGPSVAVSQVWLRGRSAAAVLQRLERLGVKVNSELPASTALSQLDHEAVSVVYALVLGAGTGAALLAITVTVFMFFAGRRRRRAGLHALLVGGVPSASLRRAVMVETGIVLLVALALGAVTAWAASGLALASLPELTGGSGGVPLHHHVVAAPLLAVLAALAGAFAVLTALAAPLILGRGSRKVRRGES
jgi:hypothetical protein